MLQNMKTKLSGLAMGAGALLTAVSPVRATNPFGEPISTPTGFFTDFGDLINDLLKIVLAIGALLVFAYLIWGGIEWITSGGDKGKTESARNKITAAVIGLIILAASYAILLLALSLIGAGDLNTVLQRATVD